MGQPAYPLGIDVGGSGIKGAPVDLTAGTFAAPRVRLETPEQSTPDEVAEVVATVAQAFEEQTSGAPVGITVPAVVTHGTVRTAANIDRSWIGHNVEQEFSDACGNPVFAVNDADAAGVAEMTFGEGKGLKGVVLLITIGSGLGSALFIDGKLVPNTELGHLFLHGRIAEHFASDRVREQEALSWEEWAVRFGHYLRHLERLFTPDHFILGGGASKYFQEYEKYLEVTTPVRPAKLLNNAGIVGAAMYAFNQLETGDR